MSLSRVGFAVNPTKPAALELLGQATAWCEARGIETWWAPAVETPALVEALPGSDVLVVLGGDGTFLRAATSVAAVDVPILGVNLGKVGFLSKAEHHDLENVLRQIVEEDYQLEPRLMLDVRIVPGRRQPDGVAHVALNEAAIVRGRHAQVMKVVVDVGDSRIATYTCDGVVIASPTGSTGYSFSAGGPILEPTSRNLVVTPIAAYLTPLRSSVVGAQHVVSATVTAAYDCLVSIDGREDVGLQVGDRVEVSAREKPISFIQPRGATAFWDLLRQKATLLPDD
jgi:NAD+ kinase